MLSWGECRKLANIISICGTSNPFVADVDNNKHVFFLISVVIEIQQKKLS